MKKLTVVTINDADGIFEIEEISASAIGTDDNQFVMPGTGYNLSDLIDYANENMAAPECGDYDGYTI